MQRRHRASKLADAIEAEIVSGTLVPGTRLGSKADLIDRYRISYGAFNEALRICQERGLVTTRTGRYGGIFVNAHFERRSAREITTRAQVGRLIEECAPVRCALERDVVTDAALSRERADVEDLRLLLARLEANKGDASYRSDLRHFHWRIAKACANRSLSRLYRMFLEGAAGPGAKTARLAEFRRLNLAAHRELVAAIAARDPERARSLVSERGPLLMIGAFAYAGLAAPIKRSAALSIAVPLK
jgi:DNA-binding FadR family transcriptional regulator